MSLSNISLLYIQPKSMRHLAAFHLFFLTSLLLMTASFVGSAHGAQITLAWDASGDSTITGYKLYWGTKSRQYALLADVGNSTTEVVSTLQAGTTYYFAATAYDARGNESAFSNEVSYTAAVACTYSITPASRTVPAAAGTGTVNVTTQSACRWTASSGTSWMSITSGGSGTGNGTVSYSVSANTGTASRASASTIAGQAFTVTQAGVQTYTLTTAKSGTGSGTVTNSPTGTTFSAGKVVTLTATPSATSTFTRWSGACSGTSTTCQVTMSGNVSVGAAFALKTYTLTTAKSGTGSGIGSGTVTNSPTGTTFNAGTVVTLTATPATGFAFTSWTGCDGVNGNVCTVTMNGARSVTALFTPKGRL